MKKLRHVNSMKEVMSDGFSARVEEVAEYLDQRLCTVNKTRRFYARARKVITDLTRDGENSLTRIYNLVRIMLVKLGELHPEYRFSPDDIDAICNASILHDIGKFLLPEEILTKPEKLLPEETEIMHRHTEIGYEIVRRSRKISSGIYARYFEEICRFHHERWDGDGYPYGLVGAQIPIYVQVVAVIDVYDALISRRDYKPTYSHVAAMEMIESGDCGYFNPIILDCFRQVSEQMQLEAVHYKTTPNYKQAWLYRALTRLNYVLTIGMISVVVLMGVSFGFFAVNLGNNVMEDKQTQLQDFAKSASRLWAQKMHGDVALLSTGGTNMQDFFDGLTPGDAQRDDYQVTVSDMFCQVADRQQYSVYSVITADGAQSNTLEMFSGKDADGNFYTYDYARMTERLRDFTAFVPWQQDAIINQCWLPSSARSGEWEAGFYLAVPIFDETENANNSYRNVVGYIACAYRSIDLVEKLDFNSTNNIGDMQIFLNNGTYIYRPAEIGSVDFFDEMGTKKFLDGASLESVKKDIVNRANRMIHYKDGDTRMYGYLMHVNSVMSGADGLTAALADWNVFCSFREEVVMHYVTEIQNSMIFFFSVIGVLMTGLVVLVLIKLRQVMRITKEMAVQYNDVRQNLEMSESKYKTVIAQTKHMVFEFDHTTQVVTHTEATAARYGFPMVYKFDQDNPVIRDRIHPDDYDAYLKMYHDILGGKESSSVNMRLKLVNGDYVWNRCTMHNIYDDEKRAVKSIGFAEDVDNILTETQHLRDSAMRDSFTGLYNKMYTEVLINKELSSSMPGMTNGTYTNAFIIMDLDKFKNINDTYGHATGDMILKNFAGLLARNARGYDLVGRVGGDEFVYFMQGIRDESAALNKAKTLIELARSIGGGKVACSISVGIAFVPRDGQSYQTLYEAADKALYVAKNNGGNNWSAV